MYQIKIQPLLDAQEMLVMWSMHMHSPNGNLAQRIDDVSARNMQSILAKLIQQLQDKELHMCNKAAARLSESISQKANIKNVVSLVDDLRRRLLDQALAWHTFAISEADYEIYAPTSPIFGEAIVKKIPRIAEDIEESAKCLTLGRNTACVFHLMRVMEICVQKLGQKLKVKILPKEESWNKIIDHVNGAIRTLPAKTKAQKHKKHEYGMCAANMDHVRIAWRNEVMHPKQTYTADEAAEVFAAVKSYVKNLAKVL